MMTRVRLCDFLTKASMLHDQKNLPMIVMKLGSRGVMTKLQKVSLIDARTGAVQVKFRHGDGYGGWFPEQSDWNVPFRFLIFEMKLKYRRLNGYVQAELHITARADG